LSRLRFDNLGRAYRSERVTIAASTGAQGNRLVDQYDRNDAWSPMPSLRRLPSTPVA
jgi:hypothetical protein